jgi:hypothetical protein
MTDLSSSFSALGSRFAAIAAFNVSARACGRLWDTTFSTDSSPEQLAIESATPVACNLQKLDPEIAH